MRIRKLDQHHLLILLFFIAIFSRVVMILGLPMDYIANRGGDELYYHQIAQTIVTEGEFSEWHLKAYRPPAYPAFVAIHFLLFGDNQTAVQIAQNVFYLGAIVLLSYAVYASFGLSVSFLCAFLLMINPFWLSIPQQMVSETIFVFLISLAMLLAAKLLSNPKCYIALTMGIILGFSALTREVGLFIGIAMTAVTWWSLYRRTETRSRARLVLVAILSMLVTIVPWTLRNYIVFRSFVPISTNGPINLYMGNNPQATGEFNWQLPDRAQAIWNTPSEHGAHEIEAARIAGKSALVYMVSNPGRTALLCVKKLWLLWRPIPIQRSERRLDFLYRCFRWLFWPPYFLLGCYGCWVLRKRSLVQIVFGSIVIGSLIHMVTVSEPRYRAPYEFLLAVPASFALIQVCQSLWHRRSVRFGEPT